MQKEHHRESHQDLAPHRQRAKSLESSTRTSKVDHRHRRSHLPSRRGTSSTRITHRGSRARAALRVRKRAASAPRNDHAKTLVPTRADLPGGTFDGTSFAGAGALAATPWARVNSARADAAGSGSGRVWRRPLSGTEICDPSRIEAWPFLPDTMRGLPAGGYVCPC